MFDALERNEEWDADTDLTMGASCAYQRAVGVMFAYPMTFSGRPYRGGQHIEGNRRATQDVPRYLLDKVRQSQDRTWLHRRRCRCAVYR